jgi:hypothetical protein
MLILNNNPPLARFLHVHWRVDHDYARAHGSASAEPQRQSLECWLDAFSFLTKNYLNVNRFPALVVVCFCLLLQRGSVVLQGERSSLFVWVQTIFVLLNLIFRHDIRADDTRPNELVFFLWRVLSCCCLVDEGILMCFIPSNPSIVLQLANLVTVQNKLLVTSLSEAGRQMLLPVIGSRHWPVEFTASLHD